MPRNPKLMFQICQKLKRGFCIDVVLNKDLADQRAKIATDRFGKLTRNLPLSITTGRLTSSWSFRLPLAAMRETSNSIVVSLLSLLNTTTTAPLRVVRA